MTNPEYFEEKYEASYGHSAEGKQAESLLRKGGKGGIKNCN